MVKVSVIMPCLNEENSVGICVGKVKEVFEKWNIDGEVIVVDNGSSDGSLEVARYCGARVIFEPRRGYGNAYRAGFRGAEGEIIVMVDSDNSYEIYDIPLLLAEIEKGTDFVVGSRFLGKMERGSMSGFRSFGNGVLRGLLKVHGIGMKETCTGFVAFRKEVLDELNLVSPGMEFSSEFLIKSHKKGVRIEEVPIKFNSRIGKSKLNEFRDGMRHIGLIAREFLR